MILHLATNTMIVSRMTQVSGDKYALSTVTGVKGTLQPLKSDSDILTEGVFGKTFQFFCEGSVDIQTGDKLRDENNVFYKVADSGVVRRQFGGIDYLKVICEKL